MSAGLLLVPALDVGFAADSFAIRDFRRFERNVYAVAPFQPADDDLDMLLPATAEQKFLGLGSRKKRSDWSSSRIRWMAFPIRSSSWRDLA